MNSFSTGSQSMKPCRNTADVQRAQPPAQRGGCRVGRAHRQGQRHARSVSDPGAGVTAGGGTPPAAAPGPRPAARPGPAGRRPPVRWPGSAPGRSSSRRRGRGGPAPAAGRRRRARLEVGGDELDELVAVQRLAHRCHRPRVVVLEPAPNGRAGAVQQDPLVGRGDLQYRADLLDVRSPRTSRSVITTRCRSGRSATAAADPARTSAASARPPASARAPGTPASGPGTDRRARGTGPRSTVGPVLRRRRCSTAPSGSPARRASWPC